MTTPMLYIGNDTCCSIRKDHWIGDTWIPYALAIIDVATDTDILEVPIPLVSSMNAMDHFNLDNKYILMAIDNIAIVWDISARQFTGVIYGIADIQMFRLNTGTHMLIHYTYLNDNMLILDIDRYRGHTFIAKINKFGEYYDIIDPADGIDMRIRADTPFNRRELPMKDNVPIMWEPVISLSPTQTAFQESSRDRSKVSFVIYDSADSSIIKRDSNVPYNNTIYHAIRIDSNRHFIHNTPVCSHSIDYVILNEHLTLIHAGSFTSAVLRVFDNVRIRANDDNFQVLPFGLNMVLIAGRDRSNACLYVEVADIARHRTLYHTYIPRATRVVHCVHNILYIAYKAEDVERCRMYMLPMRFGGDTYARGFETTNSLMFSQVMAELTRNRQRFGTHAHSGHLGVPVAALRTIHSFL
jgi:hypothetical protein